MAVVVQVRIGEGFTGIAVREVVGPDAGPSQRVGIHDSEVVVFLVIAGA